MSIARLMQQAAAGSAGAGPEPSGWTDPDLANASYDSVSFSVAGQETVPLGMFFGDAGSKLYVAGTVSDAVHQYDLSTAWDLTSASFTQSFSTSTQEDNLQAVAFSEDGSKMYAVGTSGDDVNQYSLSTAWDISTASFDHSFSVFSQETAPQGIAFKTDGSKMYIVGRTDDSVDEYNLSTAWDVSTASHVQTFSIVTHENNPHSIFFAPTGLKFYTIGFLADSVNEFTLTSAWDISTASQTGSFSVASQDGNTTMLFFKSDGLKMYAGGINSDNIFQYSTA